jgi:hypothetical protein
MTQVARTEQDGQSLRSLRRIIGAAVAAVLVAVAAGLLLLIMDPEAGSTTESTLGIAAALGGLGAAAFSIAAAIYAQAKNLWRFADTRVRGAVMAFVILGVIITIWNQISKAV